MNTHSFHRPTEVEIRFTQQLMVDALSAALPGAGNIQIMPRDAVPPSMSRVILADYKHALESLDRDSPSERIVVLGSAVRDAEVFRSMQAGAQGYVTLSGGISELVRCIDSVAGGRRYMCSEAAQSIATGFGRNDLTPRELDVLNLLAGGLGNKHIAKELEVAPGTVKTHVKAILGKLNAATRTEAAKIARDRGLVAA